MQNTKPINTGATVYKEVCVVMEKEKSCTNIEYRSNGVNVYFNSDTINHTPLRRLVKIAEEHNGIYYICVIPTYHENFILKNILKFRMFWLGE